MQDAFTTVLTAKKIILIKDPKEKKKSEVVYLKLEINLIPTLL